MWVVGMVLPPHVNFIGNMTCNGFTWSGQIGINTAGSATYMRLHQTVSGGSQSDLLVSSMTGAGLIYADLMYYVSA